MSNCHSKYLKINTVDGDYASFFLGLIDEFSKKRANIIYRLRNPLIYPLNNIFSKSYNFYGRKISDLQKKIRNNYISTISTRSTRSCDRDSIKRRVRRRIKLIRLKIQ